MALKSTQFDFRSGVLTRKLTNRSDLNIYKSGVLVGQNFLTHLQGSTEVRFGFEYIKSTRLNQEAFLYKFVFDDGEAYVIEATPYYFRFFTDGGVVTESAKNISNITNANPGVITVSSHGYSDGDEIYISDVGGMTELNGSYYLVKYIDANNFSLTDIDGNDIDTTSYSSYTSGGTTARVYEIETPYNANEIEYLQFDGRADLRYIVAPNHMPRKLIRSGLTSWSLETYTRTSDPFDQVAITNITKANPGQVTAPSHGFTTGMTCIIEDVGGMTEVNNREFTVTVIDADNFTIGEDTTSYGTYTSGGIVSQKGDQPRAVGIYAGRCFMGGTDNDPDIVWGSKSPNTSTGAPRYDDFTLGTAADDAVSLPLSSLSEAVDQIRFFVGTRNFLGVGTYGGMSKINGGSDTEPIGGDGSAVAYPVDSIGVAYVTPASFGSDIIYVQRGGEVALSFQYDFVSDGFTSVNEMIQSDEIAKAGIRKLAYQQGRPNVVWAVLNDGTLLSLTYKRSEDTSAWNTHVLGGNGFVISAMGQPQTDNEDRVWLCVRRTINGKTRHYIERSAKNPDIPEPEDYYTGVKSTDETVYLDKLYYAQQRLNYLDCSGVLDTTQNTTITPSAVSGDDVTFTAGDSIFDSNSVGKYIVVKVQNGGEAGIALITTYVSATEVKCRIEQDFTSTNTISAGGWYLSQDTISGLDYLEGETVSIVADGGALVTKTVTNGQIQLDSQVTYAIVGYSYTAILKTMPIELLLSVGSTVGSVKGVSKIFLSLRNSQMVKYGDSLYNLKTLTFRRGGQIGIRPAPLFNGVVEAPAFDRYDRLRSFYIVQDSGLPCTIQGIAFEFTSNFGENSK